MQIKGNSAPDTFGATADDINKEKFLEIDKDRSENIMFDKPFANNLSLIQEEAGMKVYKPRRKYSFPPERK